MQIYEYSNWFILQNHFIHLASCNWKASNKKTTTKKKTLTLNQKRKKSGIKNAALAEKLWKVENWNIKHEKRPGLNSCGILKIASHQNVKGNYAKLEMEKITCWWYGRGLWSCLQQTFQ